MASGPPALPPSCQLGGYTAAPLMHRGVLESECVHLLSPVINAKRRKMTVPFLEADISIAPSLSLPLSLLAISCPAHSSSFRPIFPKPGVFREDFGHLHNAV